nr:metallophosphoesterase family protein [Candidatus Sigynarchaeota archaeon]
MWAITAGLFFTITEILHLFFFLASAAYPWLIIFGTGQVSALVIFIGIWRWLKGRFFNVIPSASFAYDFDEGPWLHWRGDPRSTMTINWFTKETVPGVLEWGKTRAELKKVETSVAKMHRIELENLDPGTKYHYRLIGFSKDSSFHEFTTAPDNAIEFNFGVIGDTQNGGGASQPDWAYPALLKSIATADPAFIVHTGDITDQGNDLRSWHEIFSASPQLLASKPLHVAPGNHDTGTNKIGDETARKYPDEGANFDYFLGYKYHTPQGEDEITPFRGRYYSFTYGHCFFLFIDTQNSKMAEPSNPQWSYIERVLAGVPAGHWKIAVMHRDLIGIKKTADGTYRLKHDKFASYILPLLDKHAVDVVFQGHAHVYCNIAWKIEDDPSVIKLPGSKGNSVHFFTSGGGGNELRKGKPVTSDVTTIPGFKRWENSSHYLLVGIRDNQMVVEARYPDGSLLDHVVFKK